MIGAGGNRQPISDATRHCDGAGSRADSAIAQPTRIVESPRPHRAVGSHSEVVGVTGVNHAPISDAPYDTDRAGSWLDGVVAQPTHAVESPRPHRAVGSHSEAVGVTGGDGTPISESPDHCDRT